MTQNCDERILVTGGSGFIGVNLVSDLLDDGYTVLNIDSVEPRCASHSAVWRKVDLRSREKIFEIIKEFSPTQIFHLGARTDLDSNDVADYSVNTTGVKNLIDACVEAGGIKRVIFTSSRLVCKIGYPPKSDDDYCPPNAYGESKVSGEKIVRHYAILPFEWVIVRPTSIWGPWFDIPYRLFFDHVRARRYVHPGNLVIRKSFGFVGNTVYQLRKLMDAPSNLCNGKTFYLGDYDPIEVDVFAKKIANEFGIKPPISVPLWVLSVMAMLGDILVKLGYQKAPLTSFRLENLKTEMIHDFSELSMITGPLPYTEEEGVRLTVNWMNRQ